MHMLKYVAAFIIVLKYMTYLSGIIFSLTLPVTAAVWRDPQLTFDMLTSDPISTSNIVGWARILIYSICSLFSSWSPGGAVGSGFSDRFSIVLDGNPNCPLSFHPQM